MKPELLDAKAITEALPNSYWRVSVFDEVDSTQNKLRDSIPKHGDLITAEYQSSGRGRLDRTFLAKKYSALLFSFYVEPKIKIEEIGYLSLLVGSGVAQVLNEIVGSQLFKCKWPNDIVFGEAKIAGLLAEKTKNGVIVGIGINVSTIQADLPVPNSSSIYVASGKLVNRNDLLVHLLNKLSQDLQKWESGEELITSYRNLSATLGLAVRVEHPDGRRTQAMAVDIDSTGALVLDSGETVTVGDVVHLRSNLS